MGGPGGELKHMMEVLVGPSIRALISLSIFFPEGKAISPVI
jgi:hypothetical protein